MRKLRFICLLMLPACFLSACVPTNPFTTKQVVGLIPINSFPELEVIRAPGTASVNQPFTLTIITYGSSSCTTIDGAKVEVTGLIATITPFDRVPTGEVVCTADLASHPRTVELTFREPGEALIRVIGQNFDGAQTTKEQRITITR